MQGRSGAGESTRRKGTPASEENLVIANCGSESVIPMGCSILVRMVVWWLIAIHFSW